MTTITVGQRFESLQDFKTALRKWAIATNFTPAILDSDSRRVRAGCRTSPNCPFRIRCNFNSKTNVAAVTTLENVHTCTSRTLPGGPNIKRAETCKLKFLLEVVPQLLTVERSTSTKAIIDAVKARYGQEIAMRQAQKVKAMLVPKATESCVSCGATDHEREHCPNDRRANFQGHDRSIADADNANANVADDSQGMEDIQRQPEPHIYTDRHPEAVSNNSTSTIAATPPAVYQQVPSRSYAPPVERSNSAIDPTLINNHPTTYSILQTSPPPSAPPPPPAPPSTQQQVNQSQALDNHQPRHQMIPQATTTPSNSQTRPSTDARIQASDLMARAAGLMSEAARLNTEAAQLNAEAAALIANA